MLSAVGGKEMGCYLSLTVYVRQNFVLSDCDVMMEQDYFRVTHPLLHEHSLYGNSVLSTSGEQGQFSTLVLLQGLLYRYFPYRHFPWTGLHP